jgi:hypothetical protein
MPLLDIEPCRDDDGSLCFMPMLTMVVCCDSTLANDGDYDEHTVEKSTTYAQHT